MYLKDTVHGIVKVVLVREESALFFLNIFMARIGQSGNMFCYQCNDYRPDPGVAICWLYCEEDIDAKT